MKKTSGVVSFLVTCVVGTMALGVLAMIAANPGYFAEGRFLSYDVTSETVTFLGETADLPYETVRAIAEYPKRAVEFVGRTFFARSST